MEEWRTYKVGELVTFQNGFAFKSSDFTSAGRYPVVKIKEIKSGKVVISNDTSYVNNSVSKYRIEKDDILFALTGDPVGRPNPGSWVGRVAKYGLDDIAYLNQRVCKISQYKSELLNPKFLYYYFLLHENHYALASKATGSASQANISTKTIEDVELAVPSLRSQNAIVALLDSIEQKIDLNNRINHNLEEQAQALYKSWFIDFEPFKNGKFIESEFGKIPEGWNVKELNDVTIEMRDKVKDRTDVKVLSPVNTGKLMLSEEFFTKQVFSESIAKYLLVEPLDFAYNPARVNIGSIGCNTFGFTGCVSPVYVVFRCQEKYHNFFDLFRNTQAFKEEVLARSIGGVRQTLGYKDFSLIKLIYPPLDVVIRFNSIYDEIVGQQKHILNENDNLASLRDSLLPRLLSGELTC